MVAHTVRMSTNNTTTASTTSVARITARGMLRSSLLSLLLDSGVGVLDIEGDVLMSAETTKLGPVGKEGDSYNNIKSFNTCHCNLKAFHPVSHAIFMQFCYNYMQT